jgi:hypothetical protein
MDRNANTEKRIVQARVERGLGPLQRRLLHALRRHGRDTSLQSLAALASGLIPDLGTRPPYGGRTPHSRYVSVARAVAALRRLGLVDTQMAGTRKGRLEWSQNARPVWRFRHPSKRLIVRAVVDSLGQKS